ncbi:MAG TPA: ABC transporter permease [Gemmatimonadaceae bacterium]|nr:ABC transporter permease [Gemmatimonadaceae bacterium]
MFRLPFSRARIDAELRDEFRFHLEERVEEWVATGMSRREAEAMARQRFGDFEAYRRLARQIDEETMRQRNRFELFETMTRETRRAARVLLRTPAFSVIAFATLALGIGAATAIYTVLDAVVLRPLPYPAAGELVSILHPATVPGSGERKWGLSSGGYFFFRENNQSFSDLGMYRTYSMTVTSGGEAEMARVGQVTAPVFSVLRARPAVGRLITPEDDRPDSTARVVLSYEYWQRRFGRDPSVVGTLLQTAGGAYEIIGVTQPGITLPMPGPFATSANLAGFGVDLWLPLKLDPAGPHWNNHPHVGLARLTPGATVEAAQREILALTQRLPEVVPNAYSAGFMDQYNFRGEVAPLKDAVLGPTIPRALWMLFGAVLLVLAIAAANVANLFMVRMDSRRREAAVRTALGASRSQLAAHYLAESLLLCMAAALAGVLLARVGLTALLAIAPTSIPRLASVTMSWQSLVFAVGMAAVAGLVFGAMPLGRYRVDARALREEGRGVTASRAQRTVRSGLVVGQMALALVLLAAAGLMLRSFSQLRGVRPGIDTSDVLVFDLSLPFVEYDTRQAAWTFHREVQRRLSALPGVVSVGMSSGVPLEDYGTGCAVVWREDPPFARGEQVPCVAGASTLPGFFEALRIPVRGRVPTWDDVDGASQAVVITQALADRLWPGADPIGRGIGNNGSDSRLWYRVAGVVPEIRAEALDLPPTEAVFYPATSLQPPQRSGALNDQAYFVRTAGVAPETLIPAVRRVVAGMNPRVPVISPRSMEQVVERSMSRTSFVMILLGIAASVALLLSAVGTYGVISYLVTQRRSEIGVRIALGAPVTQVARLVMLQSVRLAVLGVAIGLFGAYSANRLLQSLLFNVSPMDPVVLSAVAAALLLIAAIASFAPARRAARTDPVEALRSS